jgi:hypothetical protein
VISPSAADGPHLLFTPHIPIVNMDYGDMIRRDTYLLQGEFQGVPFAMERRFQTGLTTSFRW